MRFGHAHLRLLCVVLRAGLEPATICLQCSCSTIELPQPCSRITKRPAGRPDRLASASISSCAPRPSCLVLVYPGGSFVFYRYALWSFGLAPSWPYAVEQAQEPSSTLDSRRREIEPKRAPLPISRPAGFCGPIYGKRRHGVRICVAGHGEAALRRLSYQSTHRRTSSGLLLVVSKFHAVLSSERGDKVDQV